VIVARPLARPAGRLYARFGLTRMSLLSESADDDSAPLQLPTEAEARSIEPLLVVGLLLLVLKTRRVSLRAVPLRRVKRPPRRPSNSLSTDQR
jgi:hypothetical protein